jgi:hypothetical protein
MPRIFASLLANYSRRLIASEAQSGTSAQMELKRRVIVVASRLKNRSRLLVIAVSDRVRSIGDLASKRANRENRRKAYTSP